MAFDLTVMRETRTGLPIHPFLRRDYGLGFCFWHGTLNPLFSGWFCEGILWWLLRETLNLKFFPCSLKIKICFSPTMFLKQRIILGFSFTSPLWSTVIWYFRLETEFLYTLNVFMGQKFFVHECQLHWHGGLLWLWDQEGLCHGSVKTLIFSKNFYHAGGFVPPS